MAPDFPDWNLLVELDDGYFRIWDLPGDGDGSILEIGHLERDTPTSQDHHPKPCPLSLRHPVPNRYHRLHWTSKLGGGTNTGRNRYRQLFGRRCLERHPTMLARTSTTAKPRYTESVILS